MTLSSSTPKPVSSMASSARSIACSRPATTIAHTTRSTAAWSSSRNAVAASRARATNASSRSSVSAGVSAGAKPIMRGPSGVGVPTVGPLRPRAIGSDDGGRMWTVPDAPRRGRRRLDASRRDRRRPRAKRREEAPMAQRLSALDATFLELEEAAPGAHMHIGSVMVFAPGDGGAPPSLDALCAHVEHRLGALPRFAQRLSAPVTGGLTNPSWEPAPSFSVADHVRRAALPAPGGRAELLDWAADFWSHRLDRARPLWEMVLLEGLEDGRWALATKTHHAMVDGVASVGVADLLLDSSPQARAGARLRPVPEPDVAAEPSGGGDLLGVPRAIARG